MQTAKEFNASNAFGTAGSVYIYERLEEVLQTYSVRRKKELDAYRIEGMDTAVDLSRVREANEAEKDDMGDALRLISSRNPDDVKIFVPEHVVGGIEVKTCRYNQFLGRNNFFREEYGAIGFSLWKTFDRKTRGNILQCLFPKDPKENAVAEENVTNGLEVQPIVLMCLLCRLHNEDGSISTSETDSEGKFPKPYAVIEFEDMDALRTRLQELATFDLSKDEELDKRKSMKRDVDCSSGSIKEMIFNQNMWFVPIDRLIDIAKVVMIGDDPVFDLETDKHIDERIQSKRLKYLKDHACKRIPEFSDEQDEHQMGPVEMLMNTGLYRTAEETGRKFLIQNFEW